MHGDTRPAAPYDVRSAIAARLESGDVRGALLEAETEWCQRPTASFAAYLRNLFGAPAVGLSLPNKRVHFSRCFTVEPVLPFVWVECLFAGFVAEFSLSEYNAVIQDLASFGQDGAAAGADAVLVALHPRSFLPALWHGNLGEAEEAVEWAMSSIASAVGSFRSRSRVPLIVQSFEIPLPATMGTAPAGGLRTREAILLACNAKLASLCESLPDCLFADTNSVAADVGYRNWTDRRMWEISKCPYAAAALPAIARQWAGAIRAALLPSLKVLVVDLDNTLWGGVIGDDGPDGVVADEDTADGSGYLAIQGALQILKSRGILLAIASKNDETTVKDAFARIPGLAVLLNDFVASRINWESKANGIQEIAVELNVGIDSVAFLDDNPVEREEITQRVPAVRVLPFVGAEQTARYLLTLPDFQKATIAPEDEARTEMYRAERDRGTAFQTSTDRTAFLASLQQEIEVVPLSPAVLKRVADLERKTNQFNLTSARLGEAELAAIAERPRAAVLAFKVRDRFGDSGIVGSVVMECRDEIAEVRSFIMSCRVIERDVEKAMLALSARRACELGAKRIVGIHRPTNRNGIVANFYEKMGFNRMQDAGDRIQWESDCRRASDLLPGSVCILPWDAAAV